MAWKDKGMQFYVIKRRETGNYVAHSTSLGEAETTFVALAKRFNTRKSAIADMGPNTCVCGPYPTDEYGGQPG